MSWFALDVSCEAGAVEAVEYALMEAGALGTESEAGEGVPGAGAASLLPLRVSGYFDKSPRPLGVREALTEALRIYGLPPSAVRDLVVREVEARDWLAEWKAGWRPVEVGRRFVVAPPWAEVPEAPGRLVVRVEPGMAFGTGTHETTRLCLAAIEKHFRGGSLLDVGTGTGVLAIAAALLRPAARVEACDTDAETLRIARENAELNGVAGRINFRVGTVDDSYASAECVCANLTADVILPLLPALASACCGALVLSGILQTQTPSVLARLRDLGLLRCEVNAEGEWSAVTVMTCKEEYGTQNTGHRRQKSALEIEQL